MTFSEHSVELAERYRDALQTIQELLGEMNWTDDDVDLAERYANSLREVKELEED